MLFKQFIIIKKCRLSKSALFLILIFITQFSFAHSITPPDSLKSEYPINDPRNPNCPCHAQQKLADEEYKQYLLALNKNDNKEVNPNLNDINLGAQNLEVKNNNAKEPGISSNSGNSKKSYSKIKRKIKKWKAKRKGKTKKHKSFIKRFKVIDDCFNWR